MSPPIARAKRGQRTAVAVARTHPAFRVQEKHSVFFLRSLERIGVDPNGRGVLASWLLAIIVRNLHAYADGREIRGVGVCRTQPTTGARLHTHGRLGGLSYRFHHPQSMVVDGGLAVVSPYPIRRCDQNIAQRRGRCGSQHLWKMKSRLSSIYQSSSEAGFLLGEHGRVLTSAMSGRRHSKDINTVVW